MVLLLCQFLFDMAASAQPKRQPEYLHPIFEPQAEDGKLPYAVEYKIILIVLGCDKTDKDEALFLFMD